MPPWKSFRAKRQDRAARQKHTNRVFQGLDNMKLIKNIGDSRVADIIHKSGINANVEVAATEFSIYGFSEFLDRVDRFQNIKMILPIATSELHCIWGNETERSFRNKLNVQQLSRKVLNILKNKVDLRISKYLLPQSIIAIEDSQRP